MTTKPDNSGLLVIDKPQGVTSHDVVAAVRGALHMKRVGHAGTLDPMATGVLVVGFGNATRLLNYIVDHDKTYLATIRLGQRTTTDDADGDLLPELSGKVAPYSEGQRADGRGAGICRGCDYGMDSQADAKVSGSIRRLRILKITGVNPREVLQDVLCFAILRLKVRKEEIVLWIYLQRKNMKN